MASNSEQPLPDDAFNQENEEKNKANLNGVVEELRGFLAGLNEPKPQPEIFDPVPSDPLDSINDIAPAPPVAEPFIAPAPEPLSELPPMPAPKELPPMPSEPPSFADSMFLQEPAEPPPAPAPIPLSSAPEMPEEFSAPDPSTVAPSPFTTPAPSMSPDDFPVPIPGTLNHDLPEAVVAPAAKVVDDIPSEEMALKPEGVVQIACVYPEGKEKQSQQFVAKLKEFATKFKKTMTIHPVYIQAWNRDTINLAAWGKSAHMSGADLIFILSTKNDAALFEEVIRSPRVEGVPVRLLYLENVALRTLYADVLVDCQRSVNVKGRS